MTELERLDFDFKSFKLLVEGMKQDARLDENIRGFVRKNPQYGSMQSQMSSVQTKNSDEFQKRIDFMAMRIKKERERLANQGAGVDAVYQRAFEQKVAEVEAYISSLGASPVPRPAATTPPAASVTASTPIARPTAPRPAPTPRPNTSQPQSAANAPFPYVAVLIGWMCMIGGTIGSLAAAFCGTPVSVFVWLGFLVVGFIIAAVVGKRMFGTSKNADTLWTIFCGIGYVLAFVVVIAHLFGSNDNSKKR